MPAELPARFRAKPTRLGDMQVGDTLIFQLSAMQVDNNRQCWLNPNAMGGVSMFLGGWLSYLKVRRRSDGYEVTVLAGMYAPSWDITSPQTVGAGAAIPVVEFIEAKPAEEQEATDAND